MSRWSRGGWPGATLSITSPVFVFLNSLIQALGGWEWNHDPIFISIDQDIKLRKRKMAREWKDFGHDEDLIVISPQCRRQSAWCSHLLLSRPEFGESIF